MTSSPHSQAPAASRRAGEPLDVQVLQTAASLENLAVTSYQTARRRLGDGAGRAALVAFLTRCQAQHAAHAAAFNAAARRAGGPAQHAADPRYALPVQHDLDQVTAAGPAVSLLGSLEDVNAQSYTRYASLASAKAVRSLFVTVAAEEAAHRAFLLAAQHLLATGPAELIAFPTRPARLPAGIGSECFPHAFYPTADASAIDQGAVR